MIPHVPVTATNQAEWTRQAANAINAMIGVVNVAPAYSASALPAPEKGRMAFVTDEAGGAVLAFGDGTAWRRVTDRAVVS